MSDLVTPLLQYGIAGIALIAETIAIMKLYNDNKLLQGKIDTVQEARLQDANEMVDKVTIPLSSLSQTMPLIYDKLKSSKEL